MATAEIFRTRGGYRYNFDDDNENDDHCQDIDKIRTFSCVLV